MTTTPNTHGVHIVVFTETPGWATVLGVGTLASIAEIRSAYRRRARETHPDHGGDAAAFRRVADAWREAKRARPGL